MLSAFEIKKKELESLVETDKVVLLEELFGDFDSVKLQFKNIIDDVVKIRGNLNEIMKDLPIEFGVGIIGGCLRDLLLKKEIKDIDLLLTYRIKQSFIEETLSKAEYLWEGLLMEEVLNELSPRQKKKEKLSRTKEVLDDAVGDVLKNLIEKIDVSWVRVSKEGDGLSYHFNNVNTLVKGVSVNNFNYDFDLLLSELVDQRGFVDRFDFGICKVHLMPDKIVEYESGKLSLQDLFLEIVVASEFINDCKNKTLTIDLNSYPPQNVQTSLERHYPRLKKKFPDFNFNFAGENSCAESFLSDMRALSKVVDKTVLLELEVSPSIKDETRKKRTIKV